MEPTVSQFRKRLQSPWLSKAALFSSAFESALTQIESAETGKRCPVTLVCEREPEAFLGSVFACMAKRTPVFLANPHWMKSDWEQVAQQIKPDIIIGKTDWPSVYPESQYTLDRTDTIMIPTGGSAGKIKFAIHTWQTLCAAVDGLCQFLGITQMHACCVLPLYHVSGFMQAVRTFVTHGELLLPAYKTIENGEHIPTIPAGHSTLSLVPTQLKRLMEKPDTLRWLKAFSTLFLGGAAISKNVLDTARSHRLPIVCSYGMTETAAMIAAQPSEAFLAEEPIRATALPHANIKIEAEQIEVQSASLCLGIYPTLFTEKDYYQTGDIGELDSNNRLTVKGRLDRLINTGGEKVNPIEIENALLETELVSAALVVPKADEEWGEIVTALYVSSCDTTEQALKARLSARLSSYKVPKLWVKLETLPLNSRGKIDRQAVAQILSGLL